MIPAGGADEPEILLEASFDHIQPVLSPDGRWLAYTSEESGPREVYVQAFPELSRK